MYFDHVICEIWLLDLRYKSGDFMEAETRQIIVLVINDNDINVTFRVQLNSKTIWPDISKCVLAWYDYITKIKGLNTI